MCSSHSRTHYIICTILHFFCKYCISNTVLYTVISPLFILEHSSKHVTNKNMVPICWLQLYPEFRYQFLVPYFFQHPVGNINWWLTLYIGFGLGVTGTFIWLKIQIMTGCLIKEVTIKAAWQRYYKSSRSMNRLNAENFSTSQIPMESGQIFPKIVLSPRNSAYEDKEDVMKIWSFDEVLKSGRLLKPSMWRLARRTWSLQV